MKAQFVLTSVILTVSYSMSSSFPPLHFAYVPAAGSSFCCWASWSYSEVVAFVCVVIRAIVLGYRARWSASSRRCGSFSCGGDVGSLDDTELLSLSRTLRTGLPLGRPAVCFCACGRGSASLDVADSSFSDSESVSELAATSTTIGST
jgi:hypothetical protein